MITLMCRENSTRPHLVPQVPEQRHKAILFCVSHLTMCVRKGLATGLALAALQGGSPTAGSPTRHPFDRPTGVKAELRGVR